MNRTSFQIYGTPKNRVFQSTWKTNNAGTSSSTQITLPLNDGWGSNNFWVDWGDGVTTNVTSNSQIYPGETLPRTHTYAVAGTYTVKITGNVNGFRFNSGGDRLKLLTITRWGGLKLIVSGFAGCTNLTLVNVKDVPIIENGASLFYDCTSITTVGRMNEWDTSNVLYMDQMFYGCILFNQNISNWNVSNVITMYAMFSGPTNIYGYTVGASVFNQNIGGWNVGNVISMQHMFAGAYSFNNGGSNSINNWNVSKVNNMSNMFRSGASQYGTRDGSFNQPIGNWNVSNVTDMSYMFHRQVVFNQPLANWERTTSGNVSSLSKVTNMTYMFGGTPYNNWDGMSGAKLFNQDIGNWNVSNVTNMSYMFGGAENFNNGGSSSINNWNVGKVTNMSGMFLHGLGFVPHTPTTGFNQPLSNWKVSAVTNMSRMFQRQKFFSQSLANWERNTPGDVSTLANVTNMSNMFDTAGFNEDITTWNVSNVTNLSKMFYTTSAFNQNLSLWNVSKCVDFTYMFAYSTGFNNSSLNSWPINTISDVSMNNMFTGSTFNQPIDNWNMSKVRYMYQMFLFSAFNQPLANWERTTPDVSTMANVYSLQSMFSNTQFNHPIENWNVSGCYTFSTMFSDNSSFNQPLNSWNMASAQQLNSMFSRTPFNQPIDNWNMSNVTSINGMFSQNYSFNQPLANWERTTPGNTSSLSNVTDMGGVFGDNAFKQYIGNWNVSKVNNLSSFMTGKTPTTFPSTYLDDIYNGWISKLLKPSNSIQMGTAKYTVAAFESKALLTRTSATITIINAVNNGSGLIQVTLATVHNLVTGNKVFISGVLGTTEANGLWVITNINNTTLELQSSTFVNTYISGGLLRTGYGWSISDGLLTVTGTANTGGLIRITTATHGLSTGNVVYIYGVGGTTNANGTWTVTVVTSTLFTLQGSTYNAAWTSGGNVILG